MQKTDFDAIIVGSGPNGLAAAITLQRAGLSVLLVEGKAEIGGGTRKAQFTLPGYLHDVCSAVHPLAVNTPFLQSLPLQQYGLEFILPAIQAAHPLDDGRAALLYRSVTHTATALGDDAQAYINLIQPIVDNLSTIVPDALAPLHFPAHPLKMAAFGYNAIQSATGLAKKFKTEQAKALLSGMSAHAIQPLQHSATAAVGLLLLAMGHVGGWPVAKGGSIAISNAMAAYFTDLGGTIETNFYVESLAQLPSAKAILFDVTPRQLLKIAGHKFSAIYKWQLERYRYSMGVFKVDWALDAPIPFTNPQCRQAGTLHLGGTTAEIARAEHDIWQGRHPESPYVLLTQQSVFDDTRAPAGKQVGWAYCHVPQGSTMDMTAIIEQQVERFAPGFKDTILTRHTMNTVQMEAYNPNYLGGDIGGGANNLGQLFTRPALRWSPYRTSAKGLYICSASTPPGGGVHGLCGYHAARRALKDIFNIRL